jgi:hypothetical protein
MDGWRANMKRAILATMACVTALSLAAADELKKKAVPPKAAARSAPKAAQPATEMVPDPWWQPEPGARITIQADAVPAAVSYPVVSTKTLPSTAAVR